MILMVDDLSVQIYPEYVMALTADDWNILRYLSVP